MAVGVNNMVVWNFAQVDAEDIGEIRFVPTDPKHRTCGFCIVYYRTCQKRFCCCFKPGSNA